MRSVLLSLLAAASSIELAASLAVPDTHVLHEKREVTQGTPWVKRNRVESHIKLPVRIGLKQNAEASEKAVEWLMEVSDPNSEKYGQHWSQEDVIKAFQPTPETVEKVKAWLKMVIHEDRITHTDNKAWFAFDASTEELEKLVHAEYYEYHNEDAGTVLLSTDGYHIPKHLQEHIDLITPGVKGLKVRSDDLAKRASRSSRLVKTPLDENKTWNITDIEKTDNCDRLITPACLQALYKYPPQSSKVSPKNSLGIFEEADTYAQEDLDFYFAKFAPWVKNRVCPILNGIDGGSAPTRPSEAGIESSLDFELAIPIIYPQTTTLYQTDDSYYANNPTNGLFNTFLDALDGSYCTYSAYGETGNDPQLDPTYPDLHPGGYRGKLMCGTYKPTNVISISYGEQESWLPVAYQVRQCNEFLKLGMQGVTIVVASGDDGVAGPPGTVQGCLGENGHIFSPTQPCGCPWITNVGATTIAPGKTVNDPEVAVYDAAGTKYYQELASGGGFSNIFYAPAYQTKAIANYFKISNPPYKYYHNGAFDPPDGVYNRDGRGIPDVAAIGDNIAIFYQGKETTGGGTSASAPIFAALINRIVDERLASGKGPLGFINPVLYQHPYVLNDITSGKNPGCGVEGFSASVGWDPVTGLGTPNYPKMSKLFNSLK
ncbi:Hypothetical protein R9X50_00040700 [Acrodontium crateriforme]|uniref:Peptidase S53 activation domain-containing protein n=1 Tax=Acrodontium crateriforme TaxID=150365 RepID=A0AAQ3R953_9PEZI|nr:Hypothetical protein R9X50_00040700 [Acrodontium crateriforme]